MAFIQGTNFRDTDTRPKTHVCHSCARDVTDGEKCLCWPTNPESIRAPRTSRKRVVRL